MYVHQLCQHGELIGDGVVVHITLKIEELFHAKAPLSFSSKFSIYQLP
jgi:hypothetical protein